MNPTSRLRALVIGSGYRARNAFLPALRCLDSHIEVVGIHSRTPANARAVGERWGVQAIDDVGSLRPGDVDLVLISVTRTSNRAVLRAVAHLAPGAALVIDTPVLGRPGDLAHLDLYRRWAQVRVAEDFMNFPQHRLVGNLIRSGALGDITLIRQTWMGYQYHGLALLKSWLGFRQPRVFLSRRSPEGGVNVTYRFADGAVGEIIEPYRRGEGSFSAVGTRGSLTGHALGHTISEGADHAVQTGRLERVEDTDGLSGFQIVGLDTSESISVPTLAGLRAMGLEDDSEFNLLRVDGLREVISSLWAQDPVNTTYRPQDAIADFLVSRAARRLPWSPVPQTASGNVADLIDTVAGRLGARSA